MSDLLKEVRSFADHSGLPATRIFDDLFVLLYNYICTGSQEYKQLYPSVTYAPETVQSVEGYGDADLDQLMRLFLMLREELEQAAPFEDVATDKYGAHASWRYRTVYDANCSCLLSQRVPECNRSEGQQKSRADMRDRRSSDG